MRTPRKPKPARPARAKKPKAAITEPLPAEDDSDWLVDVTEENKGRGYVLILDRDVAPPDDEGE